MTNGDAEADGSMVAISGYPVHLAGTAEDALAAHQVTPVAVAVCDIRLPGHDGVWLAEQFAVGIPTRRS